MPEFYMIFARKMPELYIIIAQIFFLIFIFFLGGEEAARALSPHLPNVSYACTEDRQTNQGNNVTALAEIIRIISGIIAISINIVYCANGPSSSSSSCAHVSVFPMRLICWLFLTAHLIFTALYPDGWLDGWAADKKDNPFMTSAMNY